MAQAGPKATIRCPFCGKLNRIDMSRAVDRPKCGDCARPILVDRPVQVTDADFDRVIADAEVPVLVDFYADWCGPCKMMAPLLDQLASERVGRLLVLKLDTDRNPHVSTRYSIRSIPTLASFRNGKEVAREVGAVPRARIEALVGTD